MADDVFYDFLDEIEKEDKKKEKEEKMHEEMTKKERDEKEAQQQIYSITYNGEDYIRQHKLGSGKYGKVFLYKSLSGSQKAIKTFHNILDYEKEKEILKILQRKKKCSIVPAEWNDDYKIIIMNVLDSVSNCVIKDFEDVFKMIVDIIDAVTCLSEQDLIYTDIKSDNILYRKSVNEQTSREIYEIFLGDLGSVAEVEKMAENKDSFFISHTRTDIFIQNSYTYGWWWSTQLGNCEDLHPQKLQIMNAPEYFGNATNVKQAIEEDDLYKMAWIKRIGEAIQCHELSSLATKIVKKLKDKIYYRSSPYLQMTELINLLESTNPFQTSLQLLKESNSR